MKVSDFIGKKVSYDPDPQVIWGHDEDDNLQIVADIRGWGAISQLFDTEEECINFQDEIGKFIADAINEKLNKKV